MGTPKGGGGLARSDVMATASGNPSYQREGGMGSQTSYVSSDDGVRNGRGGQTEENGKKGENDRPVSSGAGLVTQMPCNRSKEERDTALVVQGGQALYIYVDLSEGAMGGQRRTARTSKKAPGEGRLRKRAEEANGKESLAGSRLRPWP